jgi:hypothetical protein
MGTGFETRGTESLVKQKIEQNKRELDKLVQDIKRITGRKDIRVTRTGDSSQIQKQTISIPTATRVQATKIKQMILAQPQTKINFARKIQAQTIAQRLPTTQVAIRDEKIGPEEFRKRFGKRLLEIVAQPLRGIGKITSKEATTAFGKDAKAVKSLINLKRNVNIATKKRLSKDKSDKIKSEISRDLKILKKIDPKVGNKLRSDPDVKAAGVVLGSTVAIAAISKLPGGSKIIKGAFTGLTALQAGKTLAKPTPENFADLSILIGPTAAGKIFKGRIPKGGRSLAKSKIAGVKKARVQTKKVKRSGLGKIVETFKVTEKGKVVKTAVEFKPKGKPTVPKIKQKFRILESGTKVKELSIRVAKGKKIRVSDASIGKDTPFRGDNIKGNAVFIGKNPGQFFSVTSKSKLNKFSSKLNNFVKKQSKAKISTGQRQELVKVKEFQKLFRKEAKGTIKPAERQNLLKLSKNQAVNKAISSVFKPTKTKTVTTARVGERGVKTGGRERVFKDLIAKVVSKRRVARKAKITKATPSTRAERRKFLKDFEKDRLLGRQVDRKLSKRLKERGLIKNLPKSRLERKKLLKDFNKESIKSEIIDKALAKRLSQRDASKSFLKNKQFIDKTTKTIKLGKNSANAFKTSALFRKLQSTNAFDVTVKPGNKFVINSKIKQIPAKDIVQSVDLFKDQVITPKSPTKPVKPKTPSKKPPKKPPKMPPPKKPPAKKPPKRPPAKKPPKGPPAKKPPKRPPAKKPPKIPPLPRFNKKPKIRSSKRYVGLVKQGGKLLSTRRKGLTKNRALNDAAFIADNSAAASISIKRTKSGRLTKDTSISSRFRKFRKSKKPGSRLLVERRTHRIDSKGEKMGITAKGLIAKRAKARLKKSTKKSTGAKRRLVTKRKTTKKVTKKRTVLRGRKKK